MRTIIRTITTAAVLTLTALPLSAAIYMKVDGVDGRATAAGKEKWIELGSIQFMTGPQEPGAAKATLTCRKAGSVEATIDTNRLRDAAGAVPPQFTQQLSALCSTRRPIPNVTVEIDGQQHVLRNASLSSCQPAGGDTKLTLTYAECATHAKTYDHSVGGGTIANATPTTSAKYSHTLGGGSFAAKAKVIGLGTAPVAVQLERLTIDGNKATLVFARELPGALKAAAQQKLPSLVVELSDGQKWTFYEVTLEEVMISSATAQTGSSRPMESLSLNFIRIDGRVSGFSAR
jgi:type VI protein secretion system component Hcp